MIKKFTNEEILKIINAPFDGKCLPVKIAYAIVKNKRAAMEAAKAYDDTRMKMLERMAKKDDDGNFIIVNDEYIIEDAEAWNAEINELLKVESEVSVHMVSIDEFEKCDDGRYDTLSVAEMKILEFMIEA